MPVFFICIIVFVIYLRVKLKRNDKENAAADKDFWEREQKANFSRARDITALDYLTVPKETLPFGETTDENEADLQREVLKFCDRKILNLSGYSNTDLKEQYGVAHLEELSAYDQNYLLYIRALCNWGCYRYEQEDFAGAAAIMEYSLSIGSDISDVYLTLGHIYGKRNEISKINELILQLQATSSPLKASVRKQLELCRLES